MALEYLNTVIVGGWQLSEGHSEASEGLNVIEGYYAAGFRTFDCADIYTGVEDLLGSFIRAHGLGPDDIHVHTKYVPDMARLATLEPAETEAVIDRSRARLGLDTLDLVQFHWWHLPTGDPLATLDSLHTLKGVGKLRQIGLTNFGAAQVETVLARGIPIASVQTQVSVLDRRAAARLAPLLLEHGVALLAYGSVAGGLLSDRYLDAPEPKAPLENRSLVKYLLIAEEMGGWAALQRVLETLRAVADRHGSDIATVASAYSLRQPGVRACIVGARNLEHLEANLRLRDSIKLSEADLEQIETVRRAFPEVPGGVYELEREVEGKHGRIMKYNLSEV